MNDSCSSPGSTRWRPGFRPAAFRVQGDLRRSVYVLAHDDGRVIDVDEGLARRDAWITASGTGGVAGGRGKTHRTRSRFNTG
jgi:hypothetical protein